MSIKQKRHVQGWYLDDGSHGLHTLSSTEILGTIHVCIKMIFSSKTFAVVPINEVSNLESLFILQNLKVLNESSLMENYPYCKFC